MGYTPVSILSEPILTPEQCENIIASYGTKAKLAGINTGKNTKVRRAQAYGVTEEKDPQLYEQIIPHVLRTNDSIWEYHLAGFDRIQILKYTRGSHYDWHMDLGSGKHLSRKLSFIVGLSPADSYEGGEVFFKPGPEEKGFKIEQGQMILFPSFILHKVMPVTTGKRFVLVGWMRGLTPFQ